MKNSEKSMNKWTSKIKKLKKRLINESNLFLQRSYIENLPSDSKDSILALIEFKTDSNMEKVLDKITV